MATTTEKPLSDHDTLAIMSAHDAASDMLGISDCAEPIEVQEAIEKFLEEFDADRTKNTLGPSNGPLALGSLWGNSILMAYGWKWIKVIHGDWEALGLVDAERRYLALPHQMFVELLSESCEPSMAGPYSRFNAIGADHLPAAEPGSYMIITS